MAVCRVGTRPRWSAEEGARGLHPLAGGGRQILQVDRGSTHRQDQIRASSSILHRHRLQVRGPELDHHRQRHPVHGQEVLGVLRQLPQGVVTCSD